MKFLFIILFIGNLAWSQEITYSPGQKVDIVVASTYYNTEYIYLKNTTKSNIELEYALVDHDFNKDWSITLCTNLYCFNHLNEFGLLGNLAPNEEAFISINLSVNESIGTGKVRYVVTSQQLPEMSDTVTFIYTVTETGKLPAGPEVKINFQNESLTVFVLNNAFTGLIEIYNYGGQLMFQNELTPITAISFRDFPPGIYIAVIRKEDGQAITQKIAHN